MYLPSIKTCIEDFLCLIIFFQSLSSKGVMDVPTRDCSSLKLSQLQFCFLSAWEFKTPMGISLWLTLSLWRRASIFCLATSSAFACRKRISVARAFRAVCISCCKSAIIFSSQPAEIVERVLFWSSIRFSKACCSHTHIFAMASSRCCWAICSCDRRSKYFTRQKTARPLTNNIQTIFTGLFHTVTLFLAIRTANMGVVGIVFALMECDVRERENVLATDETSCRHKHAKFSCLKCFLPVKIMFATWTWRSRECPPPVMRPSSRRWL